MFFQLEMAFAVPVALQQRRRPPLQRRRSPAQRPSLEDVGFPKYEYDEQPMSLYWYGASASGMPLLQFLAYYQAVEFYFPVYSANEARRRLRNILKDPFFDPESDTAMGRLLSAIDLRRSGSFGSERDQLCDALKECVDASELAEFISESQE